MSNLPFKKKFGLSIGLAGLLLGLLFYPPVFHSLLPTYYDMETQAGFLWLPASLMVLVSVYWMVRRGKFSSRLILLWCCILFFGYVETFGRIFMSLSLPESRLQAMDELCFRTFHNNVAVQAHPFVQFQGKPGFEVVEASENQSWTRINNWGFEGRDFQFEKGRNVIRIAAIGGSTTQRGYPKLMEEFLNQHGPDSLQFEVYNFGISQWTTANSLSNFLLNVVDVKPDYVVIHHAWNDGIARNFSEDDFRVDYSHILKPLEAPEIPDRYCIRGSAVYRCLKLALYGQPAWYDLSYATFHQDVERTNENFEDATELEPFMQHIHTMVQLAHRKGIKMVITTQPHAEGKEMPPGSLLSIKHIDQCNELLRNKYQQDSTVVFVDLDKKMTGKMEEVFIDLGHMNEEGKRYKAEQFGSAILSDNL